MPNGFAPWLGAGPGIEGGAPEPFSELEKLPPLPYAGTPAPFLGPGPGIEGGAPEPFSELPVGPDMGVYEMGFPLLAVGAAVLPSVLGALGIGGFLGAGIEAGVGALGGDGQVATGGAAMANGTGVDLWGHAGTLNGVPVGGPGVPEPPTQMVAKQWKIKSFSKTAGEYWVYFFRLLDGRVMCYNGAKKSWKIWRPKKPIVLYRGKVTLAQAVKVQSLLDKMWRRVAKNTKALKMATTSTRRK